jgi:hypothetical protein
MTRLTIAAAAGAAVLLASAVGSTLAQGGPELNEPTFLDSAEALEADIASLAGEIGRPIDEVRSVLEFQSEFAAFGDLASERYKGRIAGMWVDPMPGQQGHIRFRNAVPADFDEFSKGMAVTASIGAFSVNDQHARARMVFNALVAAGYRDVVTFYDQPRDVIVVEVSGEASAESILAAIARQGHQDADEALKVPELADPAAGEFAPTDIDVVSVESNETPFVQTAADAYGGTWLRDDGVRECTGGFTVLEDGTNQTGLMSAGHCAGINQYEPPGEAVVAMTFMDQSWLEGGDVEWYKPANFERDDFYRDADNRTDVIGLRTTNTMVNNTVCFYGRQSNNRTCNHTVLAVFVNVLADNQVPVGDLAQTTNNDTVPGDSGGPWFVGGAAWGITHGFDDDDRSYFTTAQQANAQLGVHILTGGP